MNLSPFSSTVGLACGSSPFNDAPPPVNNPPVHLNWVPPNPYHARFHDALSNTKWPVVQPVFLPMERNDVHFHRGCYHHPPAYHHPPPNPACHMSVYNCCTHIRHQNYSAFPKRPRLQEDQLLLATKSAFKASSQTSQVYQTAPPRPRSPPPLVKASQNKRHHKTSDVPHSESQKRKALQASGALVIPSEKVSSKSSSVKDRIKNDDEVFGTHSLRESSTTINDVPQQCSSTTRFEPTKHDCSSAAGKKNNNSNEKPREVDKEVDKRITSPPKDNRQKDTSVPLNNVKKESVEKHCRCEQPRTNETSKDYSIRSGELPEHFTSFKANEEASHYRATQKHVQHECQKKSFEKPQEDSFASQDSNQNVKHKSFDSNIKQYTPACRCCNVPQSSPDITKRRQSIPQHHRTLSVAPRDYEEERPIKTRDKVHETNEENKNCPAISPTGYQKCSTGLLKHSHQKQQFTTVPEDTVSAFYQRPQVAEDQRCGNRPFNSKAQHFGLESRVPQLRRGRPRTRGLTDDTPICSPSDRQSCLSKSVSCDRPQWKHSMQNNNNDVFSMSSASDINNNGTTATDKMRYQPYLPNDISTARVEHFEKERQIRKQAADQPRKTTTLGGLPNHSTNTSITSHDQQYQQSYNIGNVDRNRDQIVSSTQHQHLARNHFPKPPPLLTVEPTKVSTSCQAVETKSPLEKRSDSTTLVTSLNELLKRRTSSSERQRESNNCLFNETQRQDATKSRNKSVGFQGSHCQEERQESTICQSKWNAKTFEGLQKPTNLGCDGNRQMDTTGFPNKKPQSETQSSPKLTSLECGGKERRDSTGFPNEKLEARSSHRHVEKEESGRSVARKLSRSSCEEIDSRYYKAVTSNSSRNQDSYIVENNAWNDQTADTSKSQPSSRSSCTVPLPPIEDELDSIDSGCGGFAIDHSSLPKIVAVHSIVKRPDTVQDDNSSLFSASDKKYWSDLLKKLTTELCDFSGEMELQHSKPERSPPVSETSTLGSLVGGSKVTQEQNKVSPEDCNLTVSTKKDFSEQPKSLKGAKTNDLTMREYLSSPSTDLTVHVRDPTAYAETERKTELPRKKLTIAELSKKILVTRERIKQETIPWKKKLLHSLEAIFTKKLRKMEKETGQKADISFGEEKAKEESKDKKNGQKERRNSQSGKEKIAGPRHKQTTKNKL